MDFGKYDVGGIAGRMRRPETAIAVGYVLNIAVGFLLLLLPVSHRAECPALDDLFTAVSAVSTTGLATVDVPGVYSAFGMFVILLLIQVGAVGYMTISSYAIYRVTHHASRRVDRLVEASVSVPAGISLRELTNNIIHFTLVIELLGFVSFYVFLAADGGVEAPAWKALFLSVSSFCTAGFSPFSDSLCSYSSNLGINITVAVLSYAGAMGFIMITDMTRKLRNRNYRVTFTTKVILVVTGVMALTGTVFLFLFPAEGESRSAGARLLQSFFQTMSAMTTVGFNTVDLGTVNLPAALVLCLIMFVGASPSGTGGGVKCTTMSAVAAFVNGKLHGAHTISIRGHVLPYYRVDAALVSFVTYLSVLFVGVVALCFVESFSLERIVFEAVSALGTVGISMGITGGLSVAGKVIVMLLMYLGRIGVITFGAALAFRMKSGVRPRIDDLAV